MKIIITLLSLIVISSCTSLKVNQAEDIGDVEICLINNPNVKSAFTQAYLRQIISNGYEAKLLDKKQASACVITSTYTATYGMHWGVYLATANFKIYRENELIGEANYKAPFASPAKHGRVENKIDAMVNQLLPEI